MNIVATSYFFIKFFLLFFYFIFYRSVLYNFRFLLDATLIFSAFKHVNNITSLFIKDSKLKIELTFNIKLKYKLTKYLA